MAYEEYDRIESTYSETPLHLLPHTPLHVTTYTVITFPRQPSPKEVDSDQTLALHLFYGSTSTRRPTGTAFESC